MKSLILSFVCASLISVGSVQSLDWRSVDIPLIGPESLINDLIFISADTGFIVGENNTFLRTNDRGRTWSWVDPKILCSNCVDDYYSIDDDRGKLEVYVHRKSPFTSDFLLVSTDRGVTWDSVESNWTTDRSFDNHDGSPNSDQRMIVRGFEDLFSLTFFESDDHEDNYDVRLEVYDRDRATWVLRSSILGTYSEHREPDVAFVMLDDRVGILSVSHTVEGYFYARTNDGGYTWKIDPRQQCCRYLYKIEPNILLAGGSNSSWQTSSDGGLTWEGGVVGAAYPGFDDITSHSSGLAYGVADRSSKDKLFESRDFGRTWKNYRVSVDDDLGRSAVIVDSALAFLIGYDSLYTNMPRALGVDRPLTSEGLDIVREPDRLIISLPSGWTHQVRIYDLLGREVLSIAPSTSEEYVDMSPLATGMYVLESYDFKYKFIR